MKIISKHYEQKNQTCLLFLENNLEKLYKLHYILHVSLSLYLPGVDIMYRIIIRSISIFMLCICSSMGSELFNFSDETLPEHIKNGAEQNGDVTVVGEPVQCFDFGKNGNIVMPSVNMPRGSFTIESRYFLNDYNESYPNISDIAASFDQGSVTKGFDFRVGGGNIYPLKLADVYSNADDWDSPDYETKAARAAISKSVGEFSMGIGPSGLWKEIYTNRCIERNVWTHMVATWDGKDMQLYLNGHIATDPLRVIGKNELPFINETFPLTIGAENGGSYRHFNGRISFVKIYDEALSPENVYKKYHESNDKSKCVKFIKIDYPRCGEVISSKSKLKFSVENEFTCDTAENNNGRFKIEFCRDQYFKDSISTKSYFVSKTECLFDDFLGDDKVDFSGLYFIRISGCRGTALSKAAVNEELPPALSGTLPVYASEKSLSMNNSIKTSRVLNTSSKTAILYDLRGKKVNSNVKISNNKLQSGIYFTKTSNGLNNQILIVK